MCADGTFAFVRAIEDSTSEQSRRPDRWKSPECLQPLPLFPDDLMQALHLLRNASTGARSCEATHLCHAMCGAQRWTAGWNWSGDLRALLNGHVGNWAQPIHVATEGRPHHLIPRGLPWRPIAARASHGISSAVAGFSTLLLDG